LRHRYLAVKSEYHIYQCVSRYIAAERPEPLTQENINALMECVRFVWMDYDELVGINSDPRVPHHLLIESLLHRLKLQENPDAAATILGDDGKPNPRLQKRMRYGMRFEYRPRIKDAGIMFWIGTEGRRRLEYWTNPHLAKEVRVTASSIEKGQLAQLVSRNTGELWTKDVPASWFAIELLKGRSVVLSYYTLRHGRGYKSDCLRAWDLQGSNDGVEWELLSRHTMDKSLNGPFGEHSWPVKTEHAFRFFRVIQTGHNSSNHNFLALSGMELYGDLYENHSSPTAVASAFTTGSRTPAPTSHITTTTTIPAGIPSGSNNTPLTKSPTASSSTSNQTDDTDDNKTSPTNNNGASSKPSILTSKAKSSSGVLMQTRLSEQMKNAKPQQQSSQHHSPNDSYQSD